MKEIIFILLSFTVLFQLTARQILKTEKWDSKNNEFVTVENYEEEPSGLIRKVFHQKKEGKVFIEEYYKDSPVKIIKTEIYGWNAEKEMFDKQVCFFTPESEMDHRETVIKVIDGSVFFYTTMFYKENNKLKLKTVEGLYTYELEKPVYKIYTYLEETPNMIMEELFEYDDSNKVSKYTQKLKNMADKVKIIEEYFSYPEFSFEEYFSNHESAFFVPNNNYRQQILLLSENETGLIKQVNTRNPDGTYFKEYFVDTKISNTQFDILRIKYDKNGRYIFVEQIYEEKPLYGKVYKYHMDINENDVIIKETYYDKNNNEISNTELDITE